MRPSTPTLWWFRPTPTIESESMKSRLSQSPTSRLNSSTRYFVWWVAHSRYDSCPSPSAPDREWCFHLGSSFQTVWARNSFCPTWSTGEDWIISSIPVVWRSVFKQQSWVRPYWICHGPSDSTPRYHYQWPHSAIIPASVTLPSTNMMQRWFPGVV